MTMSSSPEPAPIDITRYAKVMAHIRHFPADKHAEIIARMGIRRRDWDAAASKWQRVRDAERMSGKLDVTVRYGRVMADTRARLEAVRPSIESLGPLPGPDGASPELASAALPKVLPETKAEEASAEPAVQVPSYMAAEQHAARAPDPLPLPPPSVHPPPREMASTVLGSAAPASAAMPFTAPADSAGDSFQRAVAHAAAVQGPVESRRGAVGSGTVGVAEEIAGPPLPAGVANLTLEQYASLRAEVEARPEEAPATSLRHGVPVEHRAALDAHWKARFSADPPLRMAFARAYAMHIASLETASVADAGAAPSLPAGVPDLTLQQYASLRVELEMSPDRAASIRGRYGVSEEGRDALDAHWRARFQPDPLLRMEFARAYAAYLAWLRTNAGG